MIKHDPGAPLPWSVDLADAVDWDAADLWCAENLGPRVVRGSGYQWRSCWRNLRKRSATWLFRREEDAMWFGMVWG